jgi:hypothetical protein
MPEEKTGLILTAVVAVVAIVGIVLMVLGVATPSSVMTTQTGDLTVLSEEDANVAGQAGRYLVKKTPIAYNKPAVETQPCTAIVTCTNGALYSQQQTRDATGNCVNSGNPLLQQNCPFGCDVTGAQKCQVCTPLPETFRCQGEAPNAQLLKVITYSETACYPEEESWEACPYGCNANKTACASAPTTCSTPEPKCENGQVKVAMTGSPPDCEVTWNVMQTCQNGCDPTGAPKCQCSLNPAPKCEYGQLKTATTNQINCAVTWTTTNCPTGTKCSAVDGACVPCVDSNIVSVCKTEGAGQPWEYGALYENKTVTCGSLPPATIQSWKAYCGAGCNTAGTACATCEEAGKVGSGSECMSTMNVTTVNYSPDPLAGCKKTFSGATMCTTGQTCQGTFPTAACQ